MLVGNDVVVQVRLVVAGKSRPQVPKTPYASAIKAQNVRCDDHTSKSREFMGLVV